MTEQKQKIFEGTLTQAFDHDRYVQFLRELLDNMQLVAPNKEVKPWNTFSAAIDHYRHIGNYVGEDKNKVALFSVCLKNDKNLENARSMQRAFVKTLLESSDCAGALVAFYTSGDLDKWRLSLVRMDYEFSKGKLSEKLTPAKRYSYLVGKGEPCHTAQERLYPIFVEDDLDPSLDELEEAFSVEAVTKDFFDKYREKYLDLKEFLDKNEEFTAEASSRSFDSEQFAKKLMGQIVFLYFIQKKGWLGVNAFPFKLTEREYKAGFYRSGRKPKELMPFVYKQGQDGCFYRDTKALLSLSVEDETTLSTLVKGDAWGDGPKDFMRQIFEGCKSAGKNFFDDYLEPLFYTGRNQNRGDNAFFPPLHRRVPFLNGGLFEEMEGYDWRNNYFRIPNELFSNADIKGKRDADGILDVFDRYNFTMAEDEPMEREVAIDPEMLGKVFENLLDVKDRKSKGAFYTPREIVHFMCQESLINYLTEKTKIPTEDLRKFILFGEYFRDEDTKKTLPVDNETGRVLYGDDVYYRKHHMEFDKTKDLEMPATIFSYKYNVNRLQEIDDLLANVKVVDLAVGSGAFPLGMLTEIVKARDTVTAYMIIDMNGYQRLSYRSMRNSYRMKRETIKNSIFACDIEASATDITKLRLWLSLVIDNQIMDQENDEFGYTTKPRELPNLDCNIICGNSLMDEFKGISLITENAALKNESQGRQMTTFDQSLGVLINELIDLQAKLYDEKDHVAKDALKDQIQDIYNRIVMEQISSNSSLVDEYYQATQMPSQPFVLWQLYFPKVFRDNGGFDIVIGNPPYGLLNKKQNQNTSIIADKYEVECYKNRPLYKPAQGGMINIFRLFICKSFDLLRTDGHLSLIFPMAYMCDLSAKGLRDFTLNQNRIDYLEAFPERDDENRRVFRSAKMSVCILGATKKRCDGSTKFPMRISHDRYVDTSMPQTWMSKNDIMTIDGKSLTIPLVLPEEFSVLVKICDNAKRMKEFSKCYTGEIDLSLNKKYVRLEDSYALMLRGAQVQTFYTTNDISQGDIYYLDDEMYLSENSSDKSRHHEVSRIVMQGITGVNEKYRLKMTISDEGTYCANSVNYLLIGEHLYYFLGLCNSKVLNWFFAKLSTNSNVNGYEVDNLPVRFGTNEQIAEIEKVVEDLMKSPDDSALKDKLDSIIYGIYGLNADEQLVVERQTI